MPTYPPTINDSIDRMDARIRDLATMVGSIPTDATDAPWLPVASLGSGWTDLTATDSGFATIGVQVQPRKRVALRGGVMRTGSAWPASGFTLLTLPTGLYPMNKQSFLVGSSYGNGWVFGEVHTDGAIRIYGWGGGTAGSAGSAISLDQIVYRVA